MNTVLKPITLTPRAKSVAGQSEASASVSVSHSFFNHTGVLIEIIDRLGMRATIPTSGEYRSANQFVVRIGYVFNQSVYQSLNTALQRREAKDNNALNILAEHMTPVRGQPGHYQTWIEYPIDIGQIQDNGNAIYVLDIDYVVRIPDGKQVWHPYGEEGRLLTVSTENHQNDGGIRCDYVNNNPDSEQKCLYQRVNSVVRRLNAFRDQSRENGVYIRIDNHLTSADSGEITFAARINHDNVEVLQQYDIYQTFDLAKEGSDIETLNKIRLNQIELNIIETKRRNEQESQELESLKIEYKKMLFKAEQETALLKAELEEKERILKENQALRNEKADLLKHKMEMNSLDRKETVEATKYIPQLILGAIGLFGTILALAR